MRGTSEAHPRDVIVDVVVAMLDSEGYDAVKLQEVARRARVSLATVYKFFPSRDELILAAVERWMHALAYSKLTMPRPGESLYEVTVRVTRTVFEPWERHPRMLEAFHRARMTPGGERLDAQGRAVVEPIMQPLLDHADPDYVRDLGMITDILVYGLIGRFSDGRIGIHDILPTLERALFWLTAGYVSAPSSRPSRSPRSRRASTSGPR
jgi:AcrR family transcriptional regulator